MHQRGKNQELLCIMCKQAINGSAKCNIQAFEIKGHLQQNLLDTV